MPNECNQSFLKNLGKCKNVLTDFKRCKFEKKFTCTSLKTLFDLPNNCLNLLKILSNFAAQLQSNIICLKALEIFFVGLSWPKKSLFDLLAKLLKKRPFARSQKKSCLELQFLILSSGVGWNHTCSIKLSENAYSPPFAVLKYDCKFGQLNFAP